MKTLLTLILLCTAVITVSAQADVKKQKDYSDYKPCTECFEQWTVSEHQTSEGGTQMPSTSRSSAGSGSSDRMRKPFNQTFVGSELGSSFRIIIGGILTVGTMLILTRATHPTVQ